MLATITPEEAAAFTRDEQEALYRVFTAVRAGEQGEACEALKRLCWARERARKREKQSAATDKRRRVLVGARLPREEAEWCKAAAHSKGMSLYAWCRKALLQAACQLDSRT